MLLPIQSVVSLLQTRNDQALQCKCDPRHSLLAEPSGSDISLSKYRMVSYFHEPLARKLYT